MYCSLAATAARPVNCQSGRSMDRVGRQVCLNATTKCLLYFVASIENLLCIRADVSFAVMRAHANSRLTIHGKDEMVTLHLGPRPIPDERPVWCAAVT